MSTTVNTGISGITDITGIFDITGISSFTSSQPAKSRPDECARPHDDGQDPGPGRQQRSGRRSTRRCPKGHCPAAKGWRRLGRFSGAAGTGADRDRGCRGAARRERGSQRPLPKAGGRACRAARRAGQVGCGVVERQGAEDSPQGALVARAPSQRTNLAQRLRGPLPGNLRPVGRPPPHRADEADLPTDPRKDREAHRPYPAGLKQERVMGFWVTTFDDVYANQLRGEELDIDTLADRIRKEGAPTKGELPLLKLARFGGQRTPAGSLRNDANVLSTSGCEGDYDG